MKKIFAVFFAAAYVFCSAAYADEGLRFPVGGYCEDVADKPFTLDSLPQREQGTLSPFSSDEYDWLDNNNRPDYEYIKTALGSKMAELYDRVYSALYDFATDYSALTVSVERSGETDYYLLIPANDLLTTTVVPKNGINYVSTNWQDAYNTVRAVVEDNPQFYFCSRNYTYSTVSNTKYIAVGIDEKYIGGEARRIENEKITKTVAEYDAAVDVTASNYTIEKTVHDKIINENDYEYDENGQPCSEHYAHSVLGILDPDYSGGVCEAYAKSFQMFMNRYNVPVRYAAGLANGGGHAWNAVMLSDSEYHCVDLTWDDPGVGDSDKHALYYCYFNAPATAFYNTLSVRDNTHTVFPDSLPALSESTAYYNTAYLSGTPAVVDFTESGDYIFPAPSPADETAGREVTTLAPVIPIERTVYPTAEEDTESTTSVLQPIAADSLKPVRVKIENGSWRLSSGKYAYGNGEISFIADENCVVNFSTSLQNGGTLSVLIDGIPYYDCTYSTICGLVTPKGRHKIQFYYSGGTNVFIYDLKVQPCGDIDGDGRVTLLDAILLSGATGVVEENGLIYDADSSGIVNETDTGVILRKISGLTY